MAAERMQAPALPVIGIIYDSADRPSEAVCRLEEKWGEAAIESEPYSFDFTSYYNEELGDDLLRGWYVFSDLIGEHQISTCKKHTMKLEEEYASGSGRRFNIDAGYITGAKLVLASHKNFSHRIAVEKGIYAEITLRYQKGTWKTHPWTYPDFQPPSRHPWLDKARRLWRQKIK